MVNKKEEKIGNWVEYIEVVGRRRVQLEMSKGECFDFYCVTEVAAAERTERIMYQAKHD